MINKSAKPYKKIIGKEFIRKSDGVRIKILPWNKSASAPNYYYEEPSGLKNYTTYYYLRKNYEAV